MLVGSEMCIRDRAKIVCVDPAFGDTTLFVAGTAKALGKPLVTSDARADSELARLADVVAVSGEMMAREYPAVLTDPAAREWPFDEYLVAGSYTPLPLPTIHALWMSVVAG